MLAGCFLKVILIFTVFSCFVKEEGGGELKGTEEGWRQREKAKQRDVIKCLRATRVYPFHLSPDSHMGLAKGKPTHANC